MERPPRSHCHLLTLPLPSQLRSILPNNVPGNLAAGATARSSVGLVLMPMTVIKTRMESSIYNSTGIRSAMQDILKTQWSPALSVLKVVLSMCATLFGLFYTLADRLCAASPSLPIPTQMTLLSAISQDSTCQIARHTMNELAARPRNLRRRKRPTHLSRRSSRCPSRSRWQRQTLQAATQDLVVASRSQKPTARNRLLSTMMTMIPSRSQEGAGSVQPAPRVRGIASRPRPIPSRSSSSIDLRCRDGSGEAQA